MRNRLQGFMIFAALVMGSVAHAECTISSDTNAVPKPLSATIQADADVIVSMSMLSKLMHIDYASAAKKPRCNLGQLAPDYATYNLWGEDGGGRPRKAISSTKGATIALVVPVTNIIKAFEASKDGKAAGIEGYLLATVTKTDFTGWRFYTGMPDPVTLKHDMAEILTGSGNPIFRNGADGKTSLFVPKS